MTYVEEDGRLVDGLHPAVYLDSSVLIDYWSAEGLELLDDEENDVNGLDFLERLGILPIVAINHLLKTQRKHSVMGKVRQEIIFGEPKMTLVVVGLSLLELSEWHAQNAFRQLVGFGLGVKAAYRRSPKDIGDLLKKVLAVWREERAEGPAAANSDLAKAYDSLLTETYINSSFAIAHGLQGIVLADIVEFELLANSAWEVLGEMAFLQVGAADILHVLFAHHLGCEYFASFDADFRRIEDLMKEVFQLRLLKSPDDLLGVL